MQLKTFLSKQVIILLLTCTYGGLSAFSAPAIIPPGDTLTRVWDALRVQEGAQLHSMQFNREHRTITLTGQLLVEDDAPAIGRPEGFSSYSTKPNEQTAWVEDLTKGVVLKKILHVNNPAVRSATLLFQGMEGKGNKSPLHISINDVEFIRPASIYAFPHAVQYLSGGEEWFYIEVPPNSLIRGDNVIKMWGDTDSLYWRVLIALNQEYARGSLTRTSPNRSLRSFDYGNSWSDSKLGPFNSVDGEYSVRLSLDQYLTSGDYISPIVDLAGDDEVIKRNITVSSAKFDPEFIQPDGTTVNFLARFSASPLSGDSVWSPWQPLVPGQLFFPTDKRYFQWKMIFTTSNVLVAPELRSVKVTSITNGNTWSDKTGLAASFVKNGKIVIPSIPFVYENISHPGLKTYRINNHLDKVVEGASSQFEIMVRLLNWAYRAPQSDEAYSWDYNKRTIISKNKGNGLPFLFDHYEQRANVVMCTYVAQSLMGALLSMGFQARHINITSEAGGGHETVEVWSDEFNKWIYLDPSFDFYYFNKDSGVPLNVLECHRLVVARMRGIERLESPYSATNRNEILAGIRVGVREGNNRYPIDSFARWLIGITGQFRIMLRNDFLTNPLPIPIAQGMTYWGWEGFLNWYDSIFIQRREYQKQSDREEDFYQPLNQAKVYLEETGIKGRVKVIVDAFIPGMSERERKRILVRVNDDKWKESYNLSWDWDLRPGKNHIEVRTLNSLNVSGPVSQIDVSYNP